MNNDVATPTIVDIKDFITSYCLSEDMFDKINEDIQMRDSLSSVLICVDKMTVARLTSDLLLSGGKDEQKAVLVRSYADWRAAELNGLSTEYDRQRFERSTKIDTLCARMREHRHSSFISRAKADQGTDRVIKYSFTCMSADAKFILSTRQEVTESLEHDIVTGGLNREGLLRELKLKMEHCAPGTKYSILCFNIKNFRVINELYGSSVGDRVLQYIYTTIACSELHPVSYARFESDNFICLVQRENLDTDVINRLCYHEYIDGEKKIVFRSICGIYHIESTSISAFQACAHAKMALSFIKDQFITPWMVYEHEMQKTVISDSEVLAQVEEAMARKEFVPYFQPVVDTKTGRIEMAEALVRWKSAKHGMVSPALFIPVLERNGGLSRIDRLMESHIFSMQQRRLQKGHPVIPIDLNLSWVDFADNQLIDQLRDHILDASVPNDLVRFEITESAFDEIAENRVDVLSFFQKNDVKLLVDDFGQGYSFGTMKNVDFHIVKLDKSLIDKIGQSRKMDLLIETMTNVFHKLNTKIVAEGVETQEQVDYLRKVGCDYIQGFYFYRPMDEETFVELLEKQHAELSDVQTDRSLDTDVAVAQASQNTPVADVREETAQSDAVWINREDLEKQHNQMLQTNEEVKCLRMLLDKADIHIFEWDVKTHVDIASDKFRKMYGLPTNEIPNMPEDVPLVFEEDRERFKQFYARIEQGEKMGSDCFRLYMPDGSGYTWYRKTFHTLFDKFGKPYKAIITMRDSQDEYRYRMLRARDRMLTQRQEILTFIYLLTNDTLSLTYLTPEGDVASVNLPDFLKTPVEQLKLDQGQIAENIRNIIAEGSRSGYFDFQFGPKLVEYRAHYTMVYGEYGHLYSIIGQAEDIKKTRERLTAAEHLIEMSKIDGLTQILNRYTGEHEMEELLGRRQPCVFGILDCDKFKSVNDTFGHAVGDALLIAVAAGMRLFNDKGINMRLGGDEFAFFIKGCYTPQQIEERIGHFFQYIRELQVPGMEHFPVSVSVGAVAYDGESKVDFDTLYHKADQLLYISKRYEGNKLSM